MTNQTQQLSNEARKDLQDKKRKYELVLGDCQREIDLVDEKLHGAAPTPKEGSPVITCMSDVRSEPIEWLWQGRIALGKLTLIAGDPGLGKSFMTLDIAARVSRGLGWPDNRNQPMASGGVVLLNAEDALADTIRPRLDCAGADVAKIIAITAINAISESGISQERGLDLSRDILAIELAIQSMPDCRLVVIDPISAYMGRVDSHKNAEVRGLLAPLSALATKHRVAIVMVSHLNKSGGGQAIYRTMGSLAFTAAVRAAWVVSKDKSDEKRRLFLPSKNNLAQNTGGLAYRIESLNTGGANVVWEPDPVNVSADDALSTDRAGGVGPSEQDDAKEWLTSLLTDGPRSASSCEQEAIDAGYSMATVRRAKAALRIVSKKDGFNGRWEWALPEMPEDAQPAKVLTEGAHTPPIEHLREKQGEFKQIHEDSPKVLKITGVSTFDEHLGSNWGES
ncbi:MAG: AAA family ATPase [Planctomycetota bacterium]|nr:AAA family ATPase [Planctomycetota bacterium]